MLENEYDEHYGTAQIDVKDCLLSPNKWKINKFVEFVPNDNWKNVGNEAPFIYIQCIYCKYPNRKIDPEEPEVMLEWAEKFKPDKVAPYQDPLAGLDGVLEVKVCNSRGLLGSDELETTADISCSTTADFSHCSPMVRLNWKNFEAAETHMRYHTLNPVWNETKVISIDDKDQGIRNKDLEQFEIEQTRHVSKIELSFYINLKKITIADFPEVAAKKHRMKLKIYVSDDNSLWKYLSETRYVDLDNEYVFYDTLIIDYHFEKFTYYKIEVVRN